MLQSTLTRPTFAAPTTRLRWLARRAALGLIMGTLAFAQPVWANDPPRKASVPRSQPSRMTWGELALLPEYCPDTMGTLYGDQYSNPSPNAPKWVALMGNDFWAMHHYCWALNALRRADASRHDKANRDYLVGTAINDMNYVLANTKPTMVLIPEVLLKLGEAHLRLGDMGSAIVHFERAMELKPDYWPPYVSWAEALAKRNLRERAREVLERGLKAAPGSIQIANLYLKLGGTQERLKALTRATVPASPASAPQ